MFDLIVFKTVPLSWSYLACYVVNCSLKCLILLSFTSSIPYLSLSLSLSPSHFFIPLQPCYQLACKVSFTNFQLVCRYFLLFLYYACSMNHIFSRSDGINHHTLSSHFTSALASEIWPRKQFHLFLSIALCYFNPQ